MLIIMSNVMVDLLGDVLASAIRAVLTNINVDVLLDVNVNMFPGVMAAFEFAIPDP